MAQRQRPDACSESLALRFMRADMKMSGVFLAPETTQVFDARPSGEPTANRRAEPVGSMWGPGGVTFTWLDDREL